MYKKHARDILYIYWPSLLLIAIFFHLPFLGGMDDFLQMSKFPLKSGISDLGICNFWSKFSSTVFCGEEWLDLDSSFLSNTAVASVPNEMLQKVVLLFSVTYRPLKNFTFIKFYIVFNLKTILKTKLKQICV